MLKSANAGELAIKVAKRLRCSSCEANKPPPSHNVAKHKRAEVFNEQIMMDTFDLPLKPGKKVCMLNICDEGTGMQVCVPLWKGKQTQYVRDACRKNWKRWAEVPKRVLADGGGSLTGLCRRVLNWMDPMSRKLRLMLLGKMGLLNDTGGSGKKPSTKPTRKPNQELIDQVNHVRSSLCRKHGYAPYRHVFECDLRRREGKCHMNQEFKNSNAVGASRATRTQKPWTWKNKRLRWRQTPWPVIASSKW